MKNKILYKHSLLSLVHIFTALIFTFICINVVKGIVKFFLVYIINSGNYAYYYYDKLIILYDGINYGFFKGYLSIVIGIIVFSLLYILITYRKNKGLASIINETEIMASGDLDKVIEVDARGDIRKLAENINNISKQLKDITIAERDAQKTKNDLITNVSHDLRTPLTSIIGYLELIDTDQYKDEVALRYYVNIAYEKSKGLNLLINDLFEFTKMQNNTINLDKSDINLVELLGQVVAGFEYQFKNANMESRVFFTEDKLIVNVDAAKLVRAFENLLSNAIKYGKEGYYVDVKTKIEEDKAVVQVINYGQSISAIDLPYIFDRFYRAEKSRNSKIGGSGLGLAITKNIIEINEGTIEAYSNESKTVFEVKLPVKADNLHYRN